ncbi:MAG: glutathione S-transferase [Myxococcales bacterium]|nr:glutathione S-transferase [Myxococcales bacterium]
MSKPITLFGFAPSTYTRSARMACIEAGVAHQLAPLEFKQPSHLALHPFGKMPALSHGDVVLYETLAICSYVDSLAAGELLGGDDALARARVLGWCSVAIDYSYPALVSPLHDERIAAEARAAARAHLETLDGLVDEATFLVGGAPTLADLMLYPMVEFAAGKLGASAFEGLPSLLRWRAAVADRPCARQTAP